MRELAASDGVAAGGHRHEVKVETGDGARDARVVLQAVGRRRDRLIARQLVDGDGPLAAQRRARRRARRRRHGQRPRPRRRLHV